MIKIFSDPGYREMMQTSNTGSVRYGTPMERNLGMLRDKIQCVTKVAKFPNKLMLQYFHTFHQIRQLYSKLFTQNYIIVTK